ncbi:MAG: hypothetical protein DRJ44_01090 [Thermoprotei archaeon]|nr:MAG: hypothetical protein DRJ44_01090 [Thermoprotei archaeon]
MLGRIIILMDSDEITCMDYITCPECKSIVPKGNYCIFCGARLESEVASKKKEDKEGLKKLEKDFIYCPRCDNVVKADSRYCPFCGLKLHNYSSHSSS